MSSCFVLRPCSLPASWRAASEQTLPVPRAIGRVLRRTVLCGRDVPSASFATRDGWAVAGAGPWRICGAIRTGSRPAALCCGQAIQINTGGIVPDAADAVIPLGEGLTENGILTSRIRPEPGQFIRGRGADWHKGDVLLESGVTIGPGAIALLTELGIAEVTAAGSPRVAILSTGSEILALDAGGTDAFGCKRFASNGYYLQALLSEAGIDAASLDFCTDDIGQLAGMLEDKASRNDFIVTIGGTGKGRADFLRQAISRAGGIVFGGSAAGSADSLPFVTGELWGKPVLGLPGNPLAVICIAQRLLLPLMWELVRCEPFRPQRVTALMGCAIRSAPGDLCVRIDRTAFPWQALPVEKGTGSRTVFADLAGTIHLDQERTLAEGETVTVELFFGQY